MTPSAPPVLETVSNGSRPLDDAARLDSHLVSLHSPHSYEADQYRVLRHLLDQAASGERRKVIAVTSPAAGDGKTTTAINLAVTMAQTSDSRVLLIDADLRRPLVATSLGLDNAATPGLSGMLLDPQIALASMVQQMPFDLAMIPAGPPPDNAYRALDSPRLGELLAEARESYDHVILDTPPVVLVPDCQSLSRWVDGILIVVSAHHTPRKLLAEALNATEPEKVLGIVFNRDDRPLSGYSKYYGRYDGSRRPGGKGGWWSSWTPGKPGRLP